MTTPGRRTVAGFVQNDVKGHVKDHGKTGAESEFVSIRENSWFQNPESAKSVKSVDKLSAPLFAPLRLCVSQQPVTQLTPRPSNGLNSLPVQLAAPRRLSPDATAPPIYFQRNWPTSEPFARPPQRYEKDEVMYGCVGVWVIS